MNCNTVEFIYMHVKIIVQNFRSGVVSSDSPQPEDTPVAYVGKYLEYICSDSSVEDYFLCSRSQPTRLVEGKELLPVSIIIYVYIMCALLQAYLQ